MTDREKLRELINEYYGCDAAYYDVDSYEIAGHLLSHGVTFEKQGEWVVSIKYETNITKSNINKVKSFCCPYCGKVYRKFMNYCGNCGARMTKNENP